MSAIAFKSIVELSDALDAGTLTPSEILDDVLERLQDLEPKLNMFQTLDVEGAREAAKQSDARHIKGRRLSKLDGIPTSIKDLIAQKGLPQRSGSRSTPDTPATEDAPAVARLRRAGAVLMGKSTTSEFGCKAVGDSLLSGTTRNPWDLSKTPGGSSCGAAAAVASGLLPYAIGTDGGGSLRIPGSMSGLIGFKAQFGRVPVYPVSATPTLAHVGPLARTVEDTALVLATISGEDHRDPFSVAGPVPDYLAATQSSRKLRIAWSPTLGFARPDAEIVKIVAKGVQSLADMGHTIVELDTIMEDPEPMWTAEFYAGVGSRLRGIIESQPELIDPAVLVVLKKAVTQDMDSYYKQVFARYAFREDMRRFFLDYDVLVSPTLPSAAFDVDENMPRFLNDRTIVSWVFYTYAFNLTGQPAASVPIGHTTQGLPVGMQVVGKQNDEATVFSVLGQLERYVSGFPTIQR